MSNTSSKTKILAEGAVIVALTVILTDSLPPIYHLPQGGSGSVAIDRLEFTGKPLKMQN